MFQFSRKIDQFLALGGWWLGLWIVPFLGFPGWVQAGDEPQGQPDTSTQVEPLYVRHCAACHGDQGDGQGLATPFLYPKPRDFRSGRFRLVSTSNNVPTRDDLLASLGRGMPGSSMPSWAHLTQDQLNALVDQIMRFRADGLREQYVKELKEEEDYTDEDIAAEDVQAEIQEFVDSFTVPGDSTVVPEIAEPPSTAIAHGKQVYANFGCIQCHGLTGKGDGVEAMHDDEQYPTTARDFTAGIFKGGHDPASLYRRVMYGMPGTPMPSAAQMSPGDATDLVHYIRSLSTEQQRQANILRRQQLVVRRVGQLPADPWSDAWKTVPVVSVRLMPLWWRTDATSELQAQFVHDGRQLAVRLFWNDPTADETVSAADAFDDKAAVEWSPAQSEPFLGMGSDSSLVDLWQWRAGAADSGASLQLMDEYPFDTDVYRQMAHGKPLPDFVTARVAGNPLATRSEAGSNLAARGLGSTTFRPKISQIVQAQGQWRDGHWAIMLRRPLQVAPDAGLSLVSREGYSVAFAIWDGAHRDRASQKVISIWQDLKLE